MSVGIHRICRRQAALAWLESAGWQVLSGAKVAPGEPAAERFDLHEVILEGRLRPKLRDLNPRIPAVALDDDFRKVSRPDSPSLIVNNRSFHRILVDGMEV